MRSFLENQHLHCRADIIKRYSTDKKTESHVVWRWNSCICKQSDHCSVGNDKILPRETAATKVADCPTYAVEPFILAHQRGLLSVNLLDSHIEQREPPSKPCRAGAVAFGLCPSPA